MKAFTSMDLLLLKIQSILNKWSECDKNQESDKK